MTDSGFFYSIVALTAMMSLTAFAGWIYLLVDSIRNHIERNQKK